MNGPMNGGWPPGMPPPVMQQVPQPPQSPQMTAPGPGQGQPPQPALHMCFSASLSCSGINPCDLCAMALKQNVLAHAITAEHLALQVELDNASAERRPINPNVLAMAFFQAVAQHWRSLHQAMYQEMQLPPNQRQFQITNVSAVIGAAESWIEHLQAEKQRAAQAPATAALQNSQPASPPAVSPPNVSAAPAVLVPKVAMGSADYQKVIADAEPPRVIDVPAGEPTASNGGTHVTPQDFLVAGPPVDGS